MLSTAAKRVAAVIHRAVAIVVDAIADLGAHFRLANTRSGPLSILARLGALFAWWGTVPARLCLAVCARAPLVSDSAAVVVDTVTDLGDGLDLANAFGGPRSGDAGFGPLLARRHRIAARLSYHFIDLAIAIVVPIVAQLHLWNASLAAASGASNACRTCCAGR
jgi:hypothetical protein